jgi:hypothetical protein
MATTINAANISASFDITKLKEGMNATRAEINKLGSILRQAEPATSKFQREVDLVSKAFEAGAISSEQMQNAIAMLKEKYGQIDPAITAANEAMERQKQQIAEVESVLKSLVTTEQRNLEKIQLLNKAYQDGIIDAKQLADATAQLDGSMERQKQQIAEVESVLKSLTTAEQRNLEKIQLLNKAHQDGIIDAKQLADATARLDGTMDREAATANRLKSIIQQSQGAAEGYKQDLKLLNQSLDKGTIDLEEYARATEHVRAKLNAIDSKKAVGELNQVSAAARNNRAEMDKPQTKKGGLGAGALAMGRGALGNMAGGLVAAVGVQQLTSFAAESTAKLDEIGDAAAKAGVSFSEMITLERTLSEVGGVGVDQVRSAIGKMKVNILEARDSLNSGKPNDLANSLKKIGVDINALSRMDAVTQFQTLAAATRQIADHGEQMQVSMQMFGKAGIELVPALQVSNDQFAEMEEHLRRSNLLLSQEQAAAIGKNADEMERMRDAMTASGAQLQSALLPMMKDFTSVIAEAARNLGMLYQQARGDFEPIPIDEMNKEADQKAQDFIRKRGLARQKQAMDDLEQIKKIQSEVGGDQAKQIQKDLDAIFPNKNNSPLYANVRDRIRDTDFSELKTKTEQMKSLVEKAQQIKVQADQNVANVINAELDAELATWRQFGEDLRNDRMEMQQADREITQERDQRERAIEQMRSMKIGEADTNIAPAIRAGTVEAYKMMNKQNEDARHREEHLKKLDEMKEEFRKFNEKNTVVLSKRR